MAYIKTNWVNDVTELNAENMNHIEDGIYNSQNVEIIAISDTAPSECSTGDKYYNTEDNLIYTATTTDTWSEDGEEPIEGVFYILFSEQSSYSYDGTTLVSVGGGTEDIVISDTEPTEEGVKIWIDTGEVQNRGSELPMVYPVGSIYMSVNNTNPATLFGFGTWEQIKDTFLLSAGDTYTAGDTGGEATHTLTASEIPKHEHSIQWTNGAYGITNNAKEGTGGSAWNYLQMQNISSGTNLKAAQQSTGDGAHNNMPPYLVVYMWKRTA